jgi:hypothetical protein
MPRQTADISTEQGQRWQCDSDGAIEYRPVLPGPSSIQDESARVAGWRISPDGKTYCPSCTGQDPDWDWKPELCGFLGGGE